MIDASRHESHELAIAWQQLEAHTTSLYTGICPICQLSGPCPVANEAAALLIVRGAPIVADPQPDAKRRAMRLAIIATVRRRASRGGPGR